MKVLAASGDIGGARAVIPVLNLLSDKSETFVIVDHGYLGQNAQSEWQKISSHLSGGKNSLESRLKRGEFDLLLFSTSVKDTLALNVARMAHRFNIPIIHLLDSWTNYQLRLKNDGLPVIYPDIYAVMDELAFEEAIAAGIPENILRITGQPALSSLADDLSRSNNENFKEILKSSGLSCKKKLIVFISEPVEGDQGTGSESLQFRGYTEKTVLKQLCHYLQLYSDEIQLGLIPHPREDVEALRLVWEKYRGNLDGKLLKLRNGREAVFLSDGVAGMASILLYDAWLIGKPVISLQPELKKPHLAFMSKREGCFFLPDSHQWKEKLESWLKEVYASFKQTKARSELCMHKEASERIYKVISDLSKEN